MLRCVDALLLSVLLASGEPELVHGKRYAMGTLFEILAYDKSPERAGRAITAALAEVERLDDVMSNFKDSSELSRAFASCSRELVLAPAPETPRAARRRNASKAPNRGRQSSCLEGPRPSRGRIGRGMSTGASASASKACRSLPRLGGHFKRFAEAKPRARCPEAPCRGR